MNRDRFVAAPPVVGDDCWKGCEDDMAHNPNYIVLKFDGLLASTTAQPLPAY